MRHSGPTPSAPQTQIIKSMVCNGSLYRREQFLSDAYTSVTEVESWLTHMSSHFFHAGEKKACSGTGQADAGYGMGYAGSLLGSARPTLRGAYDLRRAPSFGGAGTPGGCTPWGRSATGGAGSYGRMKRVCRALPAGRGSGFVSAADHLRGTQTTTTWTGTRQGATRPSGPCPPGRTDIDEDDEDEDTEDDEGFEVTDGDDETEDLSDDEIEEIMKRLSKLKEDRSGQAGQSPQQSAGAEPSAAH